METIYAEIEIDEASVEALSKNILSLRPILSELSNELLEKFFIGIRRNLDLKPGPAARASNLIRTSIALTDDAFKLINALRAGELDPVSFVTAISHISPPSSLS